MNLLIAHRDPEVRATLVRVIRGGWEDDIEVVERDEGTGAVEFLLAGEDPCVAVVQWGLPGIDGLELCRIVRDFHLGRPPYIVLLASSQHPRLEDGLEAGANDCLRTPAAGPEVRDRVVAGMRFVELPWGHGGDGADVVAAWRATAQSDGAAPAQHGRVVLEAVLTPDDGGCVSAWFGYEPQQPAQRETRPQLEAVLRPA